MLAKAANGRWQGSGAAARTGAQRALRRCTPRSAARTAPAQAPDAAPPLPCPLHPGRQVLLNSFALPIAAIFTWGATERPSNLGIMDYVRRGAASSQPAAMHLRMDLPCTPCLNVSTAARRREAVPARGACSPPEPAAARWQVGPHADSCPRLSAVPSPARAPQGGGVRTLGLCPPSPNCISTAEELNDIGHYAPPL